MIRKFLESEVAKEVSAMAGKWDGGVEVTRSSDPKFGDFSTNVALRLRSGSSTSSRDNKQTPMEFAKVLADRMQKSSLIKKLEVKEPGFINFWVKDEIWQKEVENVLKSASKFGSNQSGKNKKARVEFVSANPTGPLHFGNARGGPIGDVLASVLEFSGYKVLREYLHNDIGGQVRKLGESINAISRGEKVPEDGYGAQYVKELVQKIDDDDADRAGKKAVEILLHEILADCQAMGIKFDKVYPESSFMANGQTQDAISHLAKKGLIKEKEGAKWFAPSDEFLQDRETVVVKSDGEFTYFANDIAYHRLKFEEGADLVVDILGANHHGHVPRLQAVIKAFGFDVSKFHVILYQWVRFKRGGELVKMSKRAGTFVTTREVLDEVGRDALRFFILMYDVVSHIDFDLDLAREKSSKNPVYYVQYAHARIASILKKAKGLVTNAENVDYKLLTTNYELDLIKQISRLPELVEEITASFAVHRLTKYSIELADSFHKFYENCRVIDEKAELRSARLALCHATQVTLANTLRLLGVSSPEKM